MDEVIIPEKVIIKYVIGRAIPKPESGQNTDGMVHSDFLKQITFARMGDYLYLKERYDADGNMIKDHPFNNPVYKGAKVVVGGDDFGGGSSREHAAQAFRRYEGDGIDAIIAVSLAEIFAGNCASLGIVGVTVSSEDVEELARYVQQKPSTELCIDLTDKVIRYDGNEMPFDIPEGRRQAFLTGTWDPMLILLQNEVDEVASELPYLRFM